MGREPQRWEKQGGTKKAQKMRKRKEGMWRRSLQRSLSPPGRGSHGKLSLHPLASLPSPALLRPNPHPCQSLHMKSPPLSWGLHAHPDHTAISTGPVITQAKITYGNPNISLLQMHYGGSYQIRTVLPLQLPCKQNQ